MKATTESKAPPAGSKFSINPWIEEMAKGDGRESDPDYKLPPVPVYGVLEPTLDSDEEAAARVPPKFATLGPVTMETSGYETVLCQSKQRCGKRR